MIRPIISNGQLVYFLWSRNRDGRVKKLGSCLKFSTSSGITRLGVSSTQPTRKEEKKEKDLAVFYDLREKHFTNLKYLGL
jgi:hypothetical protein